MRRKPEIQAFFAKYVLTRVNFLWLAVESITDLEVSALGTLRRVGTYITS